MTGWGARGTLSGGPWRVPLGEEGLDAGPRRRIAQQAHEAVPGIVAHCRPGPLGDREDEPLDGGDGTRLATPYLVEGRRQPRLDRRPVVTDVVGEADGPRFGGPDTRARDGEAPRLTLADAPHREGDELGGDETDARLRQGEDRIRARDHHVGAAGHAEAAAHGCPLYDGDDRLEQRVQVLEHRAELAVGGIERIGLAGPGRWRHLAYGVQVASGAEIAARAPQDDCVQAWIHLRPDHDGADLAHHPVGELVAVRGPVEGDIEPPSLASNPERLVTDFPGHSAHSGAPRPAGNAPWPDGRCDLG